MHSYICLQTLGCNQLHEFENENFVSLFLTTSLVTCVSLVVSISMRYQLLHEDESQCELSYIIVDGLSAADLMLTSVLVLKLILNWNLYLEFQYLLIVAWRWDSVWANVYYGTRVSDMLWPLIWHLSPSSSWKLVNLEL